MPLNDLLKKLYKKEPPPDLLVGREAPKTFRPEKEEPEPMEINLSPGQYRWERRPAEGNFLTPSRKRQLRFLGVFIVAGVVVYAVVSLLLGFRSFSQDNLEIKIESSPVIVSGDEVKYKITVFNRNRLALKDLQLQFYYPPDAVPADMSRVSELSGLFVEKISFPDLLKSERRIFEFEAAVYGAQGTEENAQVRLFYKPSGINARYENFEEFSARVASSSFALHWDAPQEAVSGQEINYTLIYVNNSGSFLRGGIIEIRYPAGFEFKSADPPPSGGKTQWEINDLGISDEGKIKLGGILRGSKSEIKNFEAKLGVGHPRDKRILTLAEAANSVVISSAVLSVTQTVNQKSDYIASAGEILNYRVSYGNDSELGIRGVTITAKLEGAALDLAKLSVNSGSFNAVTGLVTWTAAGVPQLALLEPGERGEVSFSVPVRRVLPVAKFGDKNFTITSNTSIDSPNIPAILKGIQIKGEYTLATKIKSHLAIGAKGLYYNAPIANSGPLPPRVGLETTYTIIWELRNTSNDVSDAEVSAYIPPHVRFTGRLYPSDAPISYDPNIGKVVWRVGTLASGVGSILPVRQVAFQVGLTPSVNQAGSVVELVGESVARARDLFTEISLEDIAGIIDTELEDDPAVGIDQGKVGQ